MPARFQNAENFCENCPFIGHQVEYTVADNDIGHLRGNRHLFDIALSELYIIKSQSFSIQPRFIYHCFGEVNSDDLTRFPCFCTRNKTIVSGAASQIDDGISLPDLRKLSWQATAQA